jgi:hypothetical protein
MTITTPAGNKVRCTSKCRYYVIADQVRRPDGSPLGARVERRSSNLDTARKVANRLGPVVGSADSMTRYIVFDSLRGEVV